MKLGVISDTHNYFDPKIRRLFAGVDHILHAGDVGLKWVILELEAIAPVTAVLGNNDGGLELKETEVVELCGLKCLVHHIVDVHRPSLTVAGRIGKDKPDLVVFGHSHKPFNQVIDGRTYLNPGYAGKPRFGLSRSVAVFHCDGEKSRAEFHDL